MITEEEKKIIKRLKDDIALVTFNDNLNYGIGNLYVNINDLKIILNLISKLQADIEIKDKVIEEIKSKLQKHINFCEQESRGHLENKVCHISLKFEKNLLEEVEKVGGENE